MLQGEAHGLPSNPASAVDQLEALDKLLTLPVFVSAPVKWGQG